MSEIPGDLKFLKSHEWARVEGNGRVTVGISDRPGGLAALARVIADSGASFKEIEHDRAFSGPDVHAVDAICTVETRDAAHIRSLHRALRRAGFPVRVAE